MERLTKSNVKVDPTAAKYMGKEVNIQGMNDRLLDLVLNGPTLNGVSKDVLRQIIRQLYDGLAHYEDMEEQGRLVVLPCKVGDSFFAIADVCLCPPNENGCDECDKCSECRYAEQEIRERKFKSVVQIINAEKNFGKPIFLTREEAEQALKGGAE